MSDKYIKAGGIETIIVAVLMLAVVIGLIGTVVIKMTNAGEGAITNSTNNLPGNQPVMQ
ncbi:MAG: hypothetical protein IJS47_00025 [Clostridia bacterium]|nr:hypothetical protein [Clostridia bacterium]